MRWQRDVVRMEIMKNTYKTLVEKYEGRDHSEDIGTDGRTITEWILGR
jgi:hypothetical protein